MTTLDTGTEVLFAVDEPSQLVSIYAELRRLGVQRQQLYWPKSGASERLWLRVFDPPPHTLRRASDGSRRVAAFIRVAPRHFVALTNVKPVVRSVRVKPSQLLVRDEIGAEWELPEKLFREIQELGDLPLSPAVVRWHDSEATLRLSITPRLIRSESNVASAEVWLVNEAQLQAMVTELDDRLVERLEFARCETAIALHVSSKRDGPPILEFDAQRLAPVLKLGHLFAPPGTRLMPPLRRDALRLCFGDDTNRFTLLLPGDYGQFRVESIPTHAFRPLADAIDYRIDEPEFAVRAWKSIEHFAMLPIIEVPEPEKTGKKSKKERSTDQDVEVPFAVSSLPFEIRQGTAPVILPSLEELTITTNSSEPRSATQTAELHAKLGELERAFLNVNGPLDASERLVIWPLMGQLHSALEQDAEAALCWSHAIWNEPLTVATRAPAWRSSEGVESASVDANWLDTVLSRSVPTLREVRAIVAITVEASSSANPSTSVVKRCAEIARFLERFEDRMPIRAAWLGWVALAKLSRDDVLGLTRSRDRLLEQLHEVGLSPDRDLPKFLRVSHRDESASNQQLDAPRFRQMREKARSWAVTTGNHDTMATFTDLIFAYGFARFGDQETAREYLRFLPQREALYEQLQPVRKAPVPPPPAGRRRRQREYVEYNPPPKPNVGPVWLQCAYLERIHMLLDGKRPSHPLSDDLIAVANALSDRDRDRIDRYRSESLIIEPNDRVALDRISVRGIDSLREPLLALKSASGKERSELFTRLLRQEKFSVTNQFRILATALPIAFHAADAFAVEVLNAIGPVQQQLPGFLDLPDLLKWVKFLESAVALVAHHDRPAYLSDVLARLYALLKPLKGERAGWLIGALSGQTFRFLARLGLRNESRALLEEMSKLVLQNGGVADLLKRPGLNRGVMIPALLRLAGGWFYFEHDQFARDTIEAVRKELFAPDLSKNARVSLSMAYVGCLGNAPVSLALPCLDEFFERLPHSTTGYPLVMDDVPFAQLRILETVVMSLATEDFSLDSNVRRLLDEDEFLIRKRIHSDVREAMKRAGL